MRIEAQALLKRTGSELSNRVILAPEWIQSEVKKLKDSLSSLDQEIKAAQQNAAKEKTKKKSEKTKKTKGKAKTKTKRKTKN